MRNLLTAMTAALLVASATAVGGAPVAAADPSGPPYVDHTEWAHWGDMSSLRVYPTPAGRVAAGTVHNTAQGQEAWTEVLTLAPDADIPGLREQFMCHWTYAEFARPGKTSWNLEPWRPVVDADTMLVTGCNPGGSEEPF